MNVCMHTNPYIHTHIHTYIHTYSHTYIHTQQHAGSGASQSSIEMSLSPTMQVPHTSAANRPNRHMDAPPSLHSDKNAPNPAYFGARAALFGAETSHQTPPSRNVYERQNIRAAELAGNDTDTAQANMHAAVSTTASGNSTTPNKSTNVTQTNVYAAVSRAASAHSTASSVHVQDSSQSRGSNNASKSGKKQQSEVYRNLKAAYQAVRMEPHISDSSP